MLAREAFPAADLAPSAKPASLGRFLDHPLHGVLDTLGRLRPHFLDDLEIGMVFVVGMSLAVPDPGPANIAEVGKSTHELPAASAIIFDRA